MFDLINLKQFSKSIDTIYKYIEDYYYNKHVIVSNIWCFSQLWSSTALGFGGWGGSSLTTAITTVTEVTKQDGAKHYFVFFDDGFAYYVDTPNEAFWEDLKNSDMADVDTAKTKYNI